MSGQDRRTNNFDLLRLAAALQVTIAHTLTHFDLWIPDWLDAVLYLFPGVPVFFLMSGFLIASSLERRPDDLGAYFRNRVLRIYPALWVCLGVSIISVLIVAPGVFRAAQPTQVGIWLAAQLSFAQFWNPPFLRGYGVGVLNGSLWSIPVEMQFYILLPILYRLFGWHKRWQHGPVLLLLAVLGVLNWHMKSFEDSALGATTYFKLYKVTFAPHLFMFVLGIGIHRHFETIHRLVKGRTLLWLMVYVPVPLTVGWLGGYPGNPISSTLLALLVFSLAFTRPHLSHRFLKGADISYGTYLYNMPAINAFRHLGLGAAQYKLIPVILAIDMLLGWASWTLVEKRMLAFKKEPKRETDRLPERRPPQAADTTGQERAPIDMIGS